LISNGAFPIEQKAFGSLLGGGKPSGVLFCGNGEITNRECSIFMREYGVSGRENRGAGIKARGLERVRG
jgi:hypothetical protein